MTISLSGVPGESGSMPVAPRPTVWLVPPTGWLIIRAAVGMDIDVVIADAADLVEIRYMLRQLVDAGE